MTPESASMIPTGLHWNAPGWLFGLLILPLLYAAIQFYANRFKTSVRNPFVPLVVRLTRQPHQYVRYSVPLLHLLGLMMLCVVLAQPQKGIVTVSNQIPGKNIILVLDVSKSMKAYDIKPNRISSAKKVFDEFISKRPNDQIGLVLFSGKSFTLVPLTSDHIALKKQLKSVHTNTITIDGTAIGEALLTAAHRLLRSNNVKKNTDPGIIVLATDGVNNRGIHPLTASEVLATKKIKCYTIGVGGEKAVVRLEKNRIGKWAAKRDIYGNALYWSRPDGKMLDRIAQKCSGKYFSAEDHSGFQKSLEHINRLEKNAVVIKRKVAYNQLFYWPLLAAVLLLLTSRLLRQTRFAEFG